MNQLILNLTHAYDTKWLPLYVLVTLLFSGALTFLVGLERELRGEPTGLSTHVLISTSCSLLMTISVWAPRIADGAFGGLEYDTSRIAASIVSGVGFLGAGAIIKNGPSVKGLSTAATLWASAAIGMACGGGMVLEGCIFTGITLLVMLISNIIKRQIDRRLPSMKVAVRGDAPIVAAILHLAGANGMIVRGIEAEPEPEEGQPFTEVKVLFANKTTPMLILDLGRSLLREENVVYVECDSVRIP